MTAIVAGTAVLSGQAAPRHGSATTRRPVATPAVRTAAKANASCDSESRRISLTPRDTTGPAVEQIRKRGYLIAGVDQNSYRWGYRDSQTGELQGFDIDLVRAIAKEVLGDPTKVRFKAITTTKRIPALERRTVDVVVRTMTILCERLEKVAFSAVYFENGQQLLTPRASPVKAFDASLKGLKVCTGASSTGEKYLKNEGASVVAHDDVVTRENQLDCLMLMQLGQVDAILTDNALAAGLAAQDPTVHLVGEVLTQEPYGVAMNKNDTDLVRRVNEVIQRRASGGPPSQWKDSYNHWLGKYMGDSAEPPEPQFAG